MSVLIDMTGDEPETFTVLAPKSPERLTPPMPSLQSQLRDEDWEDDALPNSVMPASPEYLPVKRARTMASIYREQRIRPPLPAKIRRLIQCEPPPASSVQRKREALNQLNQEFFEEHMELARKYEAKRAKIEEEFN